ncbi:MAG: acetate/propionate family kinase [Oscillospiraceae bacterium]|jgi:acetate kinase|nr:acetate/propionate family kinase [Oscillospiraceae bacterium]
MILVVNFGSSSFKFKIFNSNVTKTLLQGICERIGNESGLIFYKTEKNELKRKIIFKNHRDAFFIVKNMLQEPKIGILKDFSEIKAIGHRIVHGGTFFNNTVLINEDVIEKIKDLIPLAPIHNFANLEGILDCQEAFGNTPQFAVFDTSFFSKLPQVSSVFAIPWDLAEKYKIKKYGFHGISHQWADFRYRLAKNETKQFNFIKEALNLKVITCHLGSGSSIALIIDGIPIETSMGLTPLGGIVMGTRCGSIDPSVITYLMEKENLSTSEIDEILNKKSGILGISGVSDDVRIVLGKSKENKRCRIAIDVFCRQIIKFIGAYSALAGGIDALVFTGGIGENRPEIREKICENLGFLGIKLDHEINYRIIDKKEGLISVDSKTDVFIAQTDEEKSIAIEIVKNLNYS